ncbi:MAG TPA: N-formylglutamate amidohydrolase [Steroidobacteraceae bacterium]|nr:N-formylglutamate amidohydrolase [Steroidobacteraceae bacterium]
MIACDHASRRFPEALGTLGLPERECRRHIAYDIGAREVALSLGARLGAVVILQNYSRLVIDCNRPLQAVDSIVLKSELTAIPGNLQLSEADVLARRAAIFEPYHRQIDAELTRRQRLGRPTLLLGMHSFTPQYLGHNRPWHVGALSLNDRRAAAALLGILRREPDLVVGDNEPYAMSVESDYTLLVHGEQRGVLYVGLEVRQDLITEPSGQEQWSARLARIFVELCQVLQL